MPGIRIRLLMVLALGIVVACQDDTAPPHNDSNGDPGVDGAQFLTVTANGADWGFGPNTVTLDSGQLTITGKREVPESNYTAILVLPAAPFSGAGDYPLSGQSGANAPLVTYLNPTRPDSAPELYSIDPGTVGILHISHFRSSDYTAVGSFHVRMRQVSTGLPAVDLIGTFRIRGN